MLAPLKKSYDQPRQHVKKQRHYFADKGPSSQSYGFSSSHVWMLELDHKEGWVPKNWCFWIVVLKKTLERVPWRARTTSNPRENQSWMFIGRTDAEGEVPILWPPDTKINSLKKTLMLGKTEGRRRIRWTTEDQMVGWHHWLNGHEFEQAPGDGEGQGKSGVLQSMGLQRDMTEWLNSNTE